MHVRFANVDENFIKTEVLNGFYTNETELVRDAVRRMREEKERAKRFQEAVVRGIQAVERGETVALTPDLLQEIKQDAICKARNGEPYNSSLMPYRKKLKLELSALAKDDLKACPDFHHPGRERYHCPDTSPESGYTAPSLGSGRSCK
jgi:antitoxin ParD1/3/4